LNEELLIMGSRAQGLMGSWVQEFMGSRVQRFKGLDVERLRLAALAVQEFKSS
jgi:hypothetical protein